MGSKRVPNGPAAVVQRLYPDLDAVVRDGITNKLKKHAETHTHKDAKKRCIIFPKGILHTEKHKKIEKGETKEVNHYFFRDEGLVFIKNLLELEAFFGRPATLKQYFKCGDDQDKKKKLIEGRFRELAFLSTRYASFVSDAFEVMARLLGSFDLTKQNLFDSPSKPSFESKDSVPTRPPRTVSFIGLSALEDISRVDADESLSEVEGAAYKAVLYYEARDMELAEQYADEALNLDKQEPLGWLVKGFVAYKRSADMLQALVLHQEMAGGRAPLTAEERWHDELSKDADNSRNMLLEEMMNSLLRAWACWKERSLDSIYVNNLFEYRLALITMFFDAAYAGAEYDRALLKSCIVKGRDTVRFLIGLDRGTGLFLKRMMPVLAADVPEYAAELAQYWMEEVRNAKPASDTLNPPDPCKNPRIEAAGANLMHLENLALVLPFDEVAQFMHEVDERFLEMNRISRLKNISSFYLGQIRRSPIDLRQNACLAFAAAQRMPWGDAEYDARLKRQWQYLHVKYVVKSSLSMLLFAGKTGSEVAMWLLENLEPQQIRAAKGWDYFDRENEYFDDWPQPEVVLQDLEGDGYHVLETSFNEALSMLFQQDVMEYFLATTLDDMQQSASYPGVMGLKSIIEFRAEQLLKNGPCVLGNGSQDQTELSDLAYFEGHTAMSFIIEVILKEQNLSESLCAFLKTLRDVL